MGSSIETDRIDGASPPGVFVGGLGYPGVSIGPMVPPQHGDTSILDTPEEWLGKAIEKIVDYRDSLVRGKARASVDDAKSPTRLPSSLSEPAMAARPVETWLERHKAPGQILTPNGGNQPV